MRYTSPTDLSGKHIEFRSAKVEDEARTLFAKEIVKVRKDLQTQ